MPPPSGKATLAPACSVFCCPQSPSPDLLIRPLLDKLVKWFREEDIAPLIRRVETTLGWRASRAEEQAIGDYGWPSGSAGSAPCG
jgi:hypothetical protein